MDTEGGGECRQTCHDFDCGPCKPKVQKSFLKGNYQEKMGYDIGHFGLSYKSYTF